MIRPKLDIGCLVHDLTPFLRVIGLSESSKHSIEEEVLPTSRDGPKEDSWMGT